MNLVPLTRDQANGFVRLHHRHCGRVVSHRGAIGCEVDGRLVGVAMLGNPKARASQQADRFLVEIVRVCVAPDAPRNTASWLYARARRAAAALGFRRVETKNLATESGASLRGAGFRPVAQLRARKGWGCSSRPRDVLPTDCWLHGVLGTRAAAHREVLHVCSGGLGPATKGIRVDVRPEMQPDVVADGRALPFRDDTFACVLLDPPYSVEYAQGLYQTDYPRPSHLLAEAARVCRPGGAIAMLHFLVPMPPPDCDMLGIWGITQGCGYRIRALSVWRKRQQGLFG